MGLKGKRSAVKFPHVKEELIRTFYNWMKMEMKPAW